jgi:hypothetical protein
MGIESKYAYRFIFLRSDKWQALRLEALVREQAKCQICGEESITNDAHHIAYPESIWETTVDHLVILCRHCHGLIHQLMDIKNSRLDGLYEFYRIAAALSLWREHKKAWLRGRDKPFVPVRILIAAKKVSKGPHCRICGVVGLPLQKINIFENYTPKRPNGQFVLCEACYSAMMSGVAWPENVSKVWPAVRIWMEAYRLQVKPLREGPSDKPPM